MLQHIRIVCAFVCTFVCALFLFASFASAQETTADTGDNFSLNRKSTDPIYACACACSVFEVGTGAMLPTEPGGMVWLEWDYLNQNRNWHGTSSAPLADNDDKAIRSNFFVLGMQYFFNRSWGAQLQIPVTQRFFKTAEDGELSSTDWTGLGDIRVKAIYTGFFEDMSLGIDFGVKFPTGSYTHDVADRDTQIGTGSTDALLGFYYRRALTADGSWTGFVQGESVIPALIRDHYRPGVELNAAIGAYYGDITFHDVNIVPIAQVILSGRTSDSGENAAHPVASGYGRLILSPGLEFDFKSFSIYGDVEFPVWQNMRGEQLVAPVMFKVILSYKF